MSKFRQLVEEITKPQIVYTHLTPELQDAIIQEIEKSESEVDQFEIADNLSTAHWDPNPYGLEPALAQGSGCYEYNEDEMWNYLCEKYIEKLRADGAVQCLWDFIPEDKQDDEEFDAALTKEAIDYVEKQERAF